jgi:hypothetical protein
MDAHVQRVQGNEISEPFGQILGYHQRFRGVVVAFFPSHFHTLCGWPKQTALM